MTLAFSALGLLVFLGAWESHVIVGLARTSVGSFVLSRLLLHKQIPGQLSKVEPGELHLRPSPTLLRMEGLLDSWEALPTTLLPL